MRPSTGSHSRRVALASAAIRPGVMLTRRHYGVPMHFFRLTSRSNSSDAGDQRGLSNTRSTLSVGARARNPLLSALGQHIRQEEIAKWENAQCRKWCF